MDRQQRRRPRRHTDRDLRLHGRSVGLPTEQGAGTALIKFEFPGDATTTGRCLHDHAAPLAVPQDTDILVPANTVISTARRGEGHLFPSQRTRLTLVSTSITAGLTQPAGGDTLVDVTDQTSEDVECFSETPAVDDAFFIGLTSQRLTASCD